MNRILLCRIQLPYDISNPEDYVYRRPYLPFGGVRLLTDPTFDPAGGKYSTGPITLHKLAGPAINAEDLGSIDYVLLSHNHHSENLDHAGRTSLANAKRVFTTNDGARRLGGNSLGLTDWQRVDCAAPDGRTLRVVPTPARHGPERLHRGAVNGFTLFFAVQPNYVIYISGDTVWYQGVEEVAKRFNVRVALLHLGARVPEVGPFHLTMTAEEGVQAAHALANAVIVLSILKIGLISRNLELTLTEHLPAHRWRTGSGGPHRGRTIAIDCSP